MCSGQVDILRGKCALVTGGNSGIGKATALLLARRGAKVVLACRNERACRLAAEEIRAEVPGADLETAPVPLDLSCLKKVRRFAESILATYPRLHLLVNNAGVNTASGVTEEGVVMMSQVNYLGPYALTRLLEGLLCRSAPAAVVNLSSVTHRAASLRDPQAFLYQHRAGSYAASKLANTLFTFELHRRIRTQAVHSCAVDPGGVQTGIWRYGMLGKPPLKWVLDALYAPPSDAARVVLAASIASLSNATGCLRTDSAAEAASSAERAAAPQFFARGTFALPAVTAGPGPLPPESWLSGLRLAAWGFTALLLSMMDWPVRRFSGRRCLEATRAVPPAPAALDEGVAHALWAESASICDLPHDVQH